MKKLLDSVQILILSIGMKHRDYLTQIHGYHLIYILVFGLFLSVNLNARAAQLSVKTALVPIAPWIQTDAEGKISGIAFDLYEAISQRSGVSFDYMLIPFKRMVLMLGEGQVDIAFLYDTPQTEVFADPLGPVWTEKQVVVGLKGTNFSRFEDFANLTIAASRGIKMDPRLDDDKTLKRIYTADDRQSIKMLMNSRVDAVAGSFRGLLYNLRKEGKSLTDLGHPYQLRKNEFWLLISKQNKNPEIRQALASAVKDLKAEGVFERIISSYFPPISSP